MLRWEKSAPPNKYLGFLDGKPERNTQISRMVFLLRKVAAGNVDSTLKTLSLNSRRVDGESSISKSNSWMKDPRKLLDGWHFEGVLVSYKSKKYYKDFVK
jgi:hypothetical protein